MTFSIGASARPQSVDILIDGHRIWSTTPSQPDDAGQVHLRWPAALVPYLRGRGELQVVDSATGEAIAAGTAQFGRSAKPVEVCDSHGRWLAVNKWMRMGPSIEGDDSGMRERLLARSKVLTDQLAELGYVPYITGGTLLGAVRAGELLPHDDDTDLGILLPHEHPSDLSLDSYRLEDQLNDLGYTVVRHSTAHLQVMFLYETGEIDHYIDIFSGFYRGDDEFCQPFHVRADVPRTSIVPTQTMRVAGLDFPAPAVPEDWLASCYGPGWRTPDPSFQFVTPLATRRRFDSWFGDSQNTNRLYWEAFHGRQRERSLRNGDARHLRALSRLLPKDAPVADLGCGTGQLTRVIAAHHHDVIAVDYSYRALALARETEAANIDFRYLNLYDRRRLLEFGAELVRSARPWHFHLSHLLEGLTEEGRGNVFLFLRLVLSEGAFAFATIDTNFVTRHYRHENPETWHLPLDWLRNEAAQHQLAVEVVSTASRRTPIGLRKTATIVLRRNPPTPEHDQ